MKKFLILLLILIFPSALYVFLTAGKERSFVRLNYFGPKKTINIIEKGKTKTDTVFYRIPEFSFTDQRGATISDIFLKNRIWVACFIMLDDKQFAPSISVLMNRIEERTNLDSSIRLVTFALDSNLRLAPYLAGTGPNLLAEYPNMVHAGKRRLFLGGNSSQVRELAEEGFYKPVNNTTANGMVHFFLIDKEGCIRGIYDALSIKEADRLVDEISMLEAAYFIQNEKIKKDKDKETEPL